MLYSIYILCRLCIPTAWIYIESVISEQYCDVNAGWFLLLTISQCAFGYARHVKNLTHSPQRPSVVVCSACEMKYFIYSFLGSRVPYLIYFRVWNTVCCADIPYYQTHAGYDMVTSGIWILFRVGRFSVSVGSDTLVWIYMCKIGRTRNVCGQRDTRIWLMVELEFQVSKKYTILLCLSVSLYNLNCLHKFILFQAKHSVAYLIYWNFPQLVLNHRWCVQLRVPSAHPHRKHKH